MKAARMLLTSALAMPKGVLMTLTRALTMPMIMYSRRSSPKVFSHRWLTSRRLLERLSSAPLFSIIIVGTTRENIIAKIMPGIMNAISPTMIRMPVIMLTASSDRSLVRV